jgi:hypothetical protein
MEGVGVQVKTHPHGRLTMIPGCGPDGATRTGVNTGATHTKPLTGLLDSPKGFVQ